MDDELGGLPTGERIARYRSFALAALQRAHDTKSRDMRESFLAIAEGWKFLADRLEAELNGTGAAA